MTAITKFCALLFSVGALAQAATTGTTLTVNATGSLSASGLTATGTATMPNVYSGGIFSGSLLLSNVNAAAGTVSGAFTITPSGGGTLTGTLTLPLTLLEESIGGTVGVRGWLGDHHGRHGQLFGRAAPCGSIR
jgi:hypothetical protein